MQYQIHRKDAYKELKSILNYMDSLQEEHVSNSDWLTELQEKLDNATPEQLEELWNKYNGVDEEEPVTEDWEEAYRNWVLSHNDGDKLYCKNAWRAAMDWQKQLDKMPVSEDLEEASKNYALNNTPWDDCKDEIQEAFKAGAKWQKTKDESTTEDLGEYINELSKQFPEVSFAKLSRIAVRVAKWQKEHLWKPADGDDLPEIDREVIALEADRFCRYKVVFAHRPNPNGWDGKSVTTGKVEHYTPKTYDKGGWNIPNIKYFLDVELPKEIEL